jgi:hypothetical protein
MRSLPGRPSLFCQDRHQAAVPIESKDLALHFPLIRSDLSNRLDGPFNNP